MSIEDQSDGSDTVTLAEVLENLGTDENETESGSRPPAEHVRKH